MTRAPDSAPASHVANQEGRPALTRFVAKNGLEILIEPMHHAPVVALQAWVHVGGADENKQRAAGLAHLHEHMLFKGTRTRKVGEVARTIEAVGGEMNAWTSFDETVYHLVLGKEHGALGCELLADMLTASVFDPTELSREIEVVLEEINRAADSPMRRMSQGLFSLAYGRHAYRDPVLGSKQSVAATRRADMLAFFHEHYRPDNCTFLLVGDVDVEQGRAWVEEAFGHWQAAPLVAPADSTKAARQAEPAPTKVRFLGLYEDVQEASVTIAWPGPAAREPRTAAIDLFSVALGHGDSGRLHEELVRPRHLMHAYASAYTPKDPGLLLVGGQLVSPRPSKEELLGAIERLLVETLTLAHAPLAPDELKKARTTIVSDAAYSRETMEGQARKRGYFHGAAGSWQHEAVYMAAIDKVSGKDVSEAAAMVLAAPPAIVVQMPKEGTADAQTLTAADLEALWARVQQAHAPRAQSPKKQLTLPPARALGVHRVQLPEGPLVLLQPSLGPVVSLRVIAPGGQRTEPLEQAGLGALFANVFATASKSMPAPKVAATLAALGAHVGAFSGRNSLGMSLEAVAESFDASLDVALDLLLAPAFAEADVARERHALIERLRSRQDSPGAVASDLFMRTLFASHPYGQPSLGTEQSVAALDAGALAAHHQRYLSLPRLIVTVVGPFDAERVLAKLARAFASSKAAAPETMEEALALSMPLPTVAPEPPPTSPRTATAVLDKQQSHVLLGSQGARITDADRHALSVMAAVLNGQSGRLFADLRDVQSLAYSLSCANSEGIDAGQVLVHMACSPSKVKRALAGVRGHLHRIASEPLGEGELLRAHNVLVGGHAIDLQRAGARAMSLATGELYGLGYDHYAHYEKAVRAVTAADVARVAKQYLASERLCEVVVGPQVGTDDVATDGAQNPTQ